MRRPLVVYYRCGGGISIHAPREGCDYFYVWSWRYVDISIHAPREGCDWITSAPATKEFDNFNPRTPRGVRQFHQPSYSATGGFQSTHPARGATSTSNSSRARIAISIHAPREGCDRMGAHTQSDGRYFNPRTPRGVRLVIGVLHRAPAGFQSTHPARGATFCF